MTCINTERIIDAGNESSESSIRVPSLCRRTGKMLAVSSLRLLPYKPPCRRCSLTFFPKMFNVIDTNHVRSPELRVHGVRG